MLKQVIKKSVLLAALLGASVATFAQSNPVDTKGTVPYVIDSRGLVAKSGAGLCWRTGYWTPAAAADAKAGQLPVGCECDKDLLPKGACDAAASTAASGAKPTSDKITLNADALFDFNKATLKPEGKAALDDFYTKVNRIKLEVLIAVGYADRFGSDAYNQKLSEKRAEAVKAYLVSKGIEKNRIYTEGKGKKNPVTKPEDCKGPKSAKVVACLQPDRRVELEAVGTYTWEQK
ncbi:MAG TPA: OmpA family protein [Rhodocyclaceae bacterium]|nr:OmpA family protein [Rhodocyclaceae bacterium]